MKTLILTRADVAGLVDMTSVVPAVREAFAAHADDTAQMPAKVYLDLPRYAGDFRAMPALMGGSAGVKWVNSHPENPGRFGLPSVMGVYILSDPMSAYPLAIMDATLLTALRTGAAAAVASEALAPAPASSLGIVGCGVQARFVVDAHRVTHPGLDLVVADRDPAAAERFAEESGGRAASTADAARCDIVCTLTPSRSPVVALDDLDGPTHINAMGADAAGKQELDTLILMEGRVVIDDWDQATHSGEINVPLTRGDYSTDAVHATLGEVVIGTAEGRGDASITVFDSTGLAIQDVAVARVIYDAARETGAGLSVDLIGG